MTKLSSAEIGIRIRKAREESRLTQNQLAAAIGIACGSVSRLERGDYEPSLGTAASIANVLGLEIEYLIHGNAEKSGRGLLKKISAESARLTPAQQRVVLDLIKSLLLRRKNPVI